MVHQYNFSLVYSASYHSIIITSVNDYNFIAGANIVMLQSNITQHSHWSYKMKATAYTPGWKLTEVIGKIIDLFSSKACLHVGRYFHYYIRLAPFKVIICPV